MDAIEILGELLGRKSSGSGRGTDILKDIFRRGGSQATPRASQPRSAPKPRSHDIARDAADLEDLLNVANDQRRQQADPATMPSRKSQRSSTQSPSRGSHTGSESSGDRSSHRSPDDLNQHSLILARAMINAAKSDGRLNDAEQATILQRLGGASRDTIEFLREEFAKPLDVREFAWSVPIGMEQQVYTMSLIAIDLDTTREADYLAELARALRIPKEICDQIQESLGTGSL